MLEMVVSSGQILDAGYLMLDIQECTNCEVQRQPVRSNQDPVSAQKIQPSQAYL